MIQWATTIGRPDILFAASSLSRFSAAPRKGHLDLILHTLGYLKKFPHRRIQIDSQPLIWDTPKPDPTFHEDFLEDYPDAKGEIDPNLPTPYGNELETSIFFDADHAHDQKTRRSITGLIILVGRTPVLWSSKRQGCIATSTYTAEKTKFLMSQVVSRFNREFLGLCFFVTYLSYRNPSTGSEPSVTEI